MSPFVGVQTVETLEALETLVREYQADSYWFLKWPHKVSGFIDQPPKDLSSEGQLIHADYEIRWKPKHHLFSVLLLDSKGSKDKFKALEGEWKTREVPGMVYEPPIPKFAKLKRSPIQVRQRYFIDARTETIHFVALTPQKANAQT